MKITVFQSSKGDCLLLEEGNGTGKRMLADGGMAKSYSAHVAGAMGELQRKKKSLDLLYVSHIDDDHISGVRQLLDDLVAWRVFDFQSKNGNTRVKQPKVPRPPTPKSIWHNGFSTVLGENSGDIEDTLSAAATVLTVAPDKMRTADGKRFVVDLAEECGDLATGVKTAIQVSARISPEQLNIPLNEPRQGKLMCVRDSKKPEKTNLGELRVFVLGPRKSDLERLRKEWNDWLRKNKETLRTLRQKGKETEDKLDNAAGRIMQPLLEQAKVLGNSSSVTPPNLASLMLLVEEGPAATPKRVLLTGDGLGSEVIHGLKDLGKLRADGSLHVDVLKMMHHGSEHNMNARFPLLITADHYIFCGNGFSDNPEEVVIKAVINSRLGTGKKRSGNPETGNPFTLWFNTHSTVTDSQFKTYMRKVETLVSKLAKGSKGQMEVKFLKGHSFSLSI